MKELISRSFGNKRWAVLGANNTQEKKGYQIYQALKQSRISVYPINPKYDVVDGDRCYHRYEEIEVPPDVVDIVVNPTLSLHFVMHFPAHLKKPVLFFQPDTYDSHVIETAKQKGFEVIYDHCVLVELNKMVTRIQKQSQRAIDFLKDTMKNSCTSGLVLGISGGIDSAVVAYLIKKASPKGAVGVILPCKSVEKDRQDAIAVCQAVGLPYHEIDITAIHETMMQKIEHSIGAVTKLTDANMRARLRMTTLYAFANQQNALVVGTDNAAEIHTGYYTKYGDGGVDLLPIGMLLKSEVYQWARHFGIPDAIQHRAPSAGLWEGQTDEQELGTSYDNIDRYLVGTPIPEHDEQKIKKLHDATEHKRQMPPVASLK